MRGVRNEPMKRHWVDTRLRVNAGIDWPACRTGSLYDPDVARWWTTSAREAVTCGRCRRLVDVSKPSL